jgi:transposase
MPWLDDMIACQPAKVAAVALANKNTRIIWALMKQGRTYQKSLTVPAT